MTRRVIGRFSQEKGEFSAPTGDRFRKLAQSSKLVNSHRRPDCQGVVGHRGELIWSRVRPLARTSKKRWLQQERLASVPLREWFLWQKILGQVC
jgi:hypothetical protein